MSATEIEYGYADANGNETWPDADGELYLDGNYYTVRSCDLRELQDAAAVDERGIHIIERTISRSESRLAHTPLPTAPGSVISACTSDVHSGLYARDDTVENVDGDLAWVRLDDNGPRWTRSGSLRDVEVLFDAGADRG